MPRRSTRRATPRAPTRPPLRETDHAALQTAARTRLAERAAQVYSRLTADAPIDLTVPMGAPVADVALELRGVLDHIVDHRNVRILRCEDADGLVRFSTLGLGLVGKSDLVVEWAAEHEEAARGILTDLVLSTLTGGEDEKIYVGRKVYAARFGLAYEMKALGWPSPESLHHAFAVASAHYHAPTTPPFVALKLVVDVRDNVDLPGGGGDTMAVWRKLDGNDVFTGVVRLSLPSPAWQAVGQPFSMARLLDRDGPLDGPCRILAPDTFVEVIQTYDSA